ncbi:MAG: dienelactone hydrolase family protein [Balneolales bacterium]|nr:dienelactone hydrolase family protein [Balneolales bacterium]
MNFKSGFFLFIGLTFLALSCGRHDHDSQGDNSGDYTSRMAHEHHGEAPVSNESSNYEPRTAVSDMMVVYGKLENELNGYLAFPADAADDHNLPAVVLIHEWWGLNDNIRMMARRLAGEGYRVLAVDFYNGTTAENSEEAQQLMRAAMNQPEDGLLNLNQAFRFMNEQSSALAVMGWCFGGAWTLNSAIHHSELLDAGVIYYGRVNTNIEDLTRIHIPLLGIFGEEDRGIPADEVRKFNELLTSLGKNAQIHIYEGADHAFANPSGSRYEPEAAAHAWQKTLSFLNEHLN